jgi:hypothetical protein
MNISENVIIVLENQERYIVLNEINYEEDKYYLLMGIDNNNDVISSKVVFIKTINDNDDLYVIKINDEQLIKNLTKVLKSN